MSIKRIWMDGDTMRVDEISPEDFYRQPKEASMTDKIDTSTLGRIDLASGKSPPIEECVSTWAVDDLVEAPSIVSPFAQQMQRIEDKLDQLLVQPKAADRIQSLIGAAKDAEALLCEGVPDSPAVREVLMRLRATLSHKDMSK